MNDAHQRNRFEVLRPLLDTQARKDLDAQQRILEMFPDQSWSEIAKTIQELRDKAQNSTAALTHRLSLAVSGAAGETTQELVAALKKLTVPDLKQVGAGLGLPCEGNKTEIVAALQAWLKSGGEVKPKSREEQLQELVQPYLDQAQPLMDNVDSEKASQLLRIIDAAYKDKTLGAEGFKAFAAGLQITVNGTKAKMKSQLIDFINRLSVMHTQTHS